MRRIGPLALVVMSLLAGCGGGGGKSLDEQAAEALLAVADFPAGWSKAPQQEETVGDDNQFCEHLDPDDEFKPDGEAEAQYQSTQTGQFAMHGVALYKSVEEAREVMAVLRKGVDECKTFTDTEDGETFNGTLTAATPPSIGDEAIAGKIAAEASGVKLTADLVMVRKGRGVTMVMSMGMQPAAGLIDDIARKAVDKLGQAAA